MAIQIILFILLLPVLFGYWASATMFFKKKYDIAFYRIQQVIDWIKYQKYLPGSIMHEIRVRKEIVRTEKYFAKQRQQDISDMRHDGSIEAIARRLQVTNHKGPYNSPWEKEPKRPPMWIKYIIAQIVR